jgi:hypothetical protein
MNQAEIFLRERVRGMSMGAAIVGGFGAAWLTMGMTGAGVPVQIALAVVVPVFALIAGLGSVVRRRLPKMAGEESPEKKQMMRHFAVVNVVEWVAIIGTVNVLNNFHLQGWAVSAIVLIVGAHFIPLALIFQAPQHRATGVALMLCAAMALVLPGSVRDVVECIAAGVILWASGACALYTAFRLAPRPPLAARAGL